MLIKISNYEDLDLGLDVAAESAMLLAMQIALGNDRSPIQVVGEGQYEDLQFGEQQVHRVTSRLRPIR